MKKLLVPALFALLGCATGCFQTRMNPGTVRSAGNEDPILSIEAGNVAYHGGGRMFARYIVDRATQTCWMMIYQGLAPLDCCAARRADGVRDVVTWETDESCERSEPATPAVSLPDAHTDG